MRCLESTLEDFRKQLNELCSQVKKRFGELGEMDMITYRSDPVISDLRKKICDLYRKAVNICKTYGAALKICEVFKEEPVCLAQLMLSDELACPLPTEEEK